MAVRRGLLCCAVGLVLLLTALGAGPLGWAVASLGAAVLAVATDRRAAVDAVTGLGPADAVTMTRATLACGVLALVADAAAGADVVGRLVPLTAVALVLDLVDGKVARGTGTVSAFGARLDGEADAFLILVLSVHVSRDVGAWVLGLGLVRYAYAAVAALVPWMQRPLPPRYWRKVVAAYVGVTLAVASSDRLPDPTAYAALLLAALLLAESFGWDVVWLWRTRRLNRPAPESVRTVKTPRPGR